MRITFIHILLFYCGILFSQEYTWNPKTIKENKVERAIVVEGLNSDYKINTDINFIEVEYLFDLEGNIIKEIWPNIRTTSSYQWSYKETDYYNENKQLSMIIDSEFRDGNNERNDTTWVSYGKNYEYETIKNFYNLKNLNGELTILNQEERKTATICFNNFSQEEISINEYLYSENQDSIILRKVLKDYHFDDSLLTQQICPDYFERIVRDYPELFQKPIKETVTDVFVYNLNYDLKYHLDYKWLNGNKRELMYMLNELNLIDRCFIYTILPTGERISQGYYDYFYSYYD